MNANQKAVEAVQMAAPEKSRNMTVNVRGNMIAVQLVRDAFEAEAFSTYTETVNHLWDALTAIGAKFNLHRAGGVELHTGRSRYGKELYMATFEVCS
jgi:hypothetical protein